MQVVLVLPILGYDHLRSGPTCRCSDYHPESSKSASVAFDTLSAAISRNADVVIIDTAGRFNKLD
jgi:signal recognition particle GTPase